MIVHNVTTVQLRKLVEAIGANEDFPKITDDPYVNYLVDCIVCDNPEDEETPFDPALYPADEHLAVKRD